MPKKAEGLTARKVDTIKTPGLFADGGGLYLQVTAAGAKTWIFRYKLADRRRDMGLGSTSTVGLAEAREKAQAAQKLVKDGIDPIEDKKAKAAAKALDAANARTFKECAEAYIEAHRAGWKNPKHAAQWPSSLETYAYPIIGALPIAEIDTPLVLQVLNPIWNTKTETANRLRGRIEMILDYARVKGYRTGDNPARWRGHLDHTLLSRDKASPRGHHASLPYADMPGFWPKLQVQDGIGARALEFCILTAGRTGEVLGARWDEIDTEAATWTIPADRMKAGQEHRVPLTAPALSLLRKMAAIRTGEFMFPSQSPRRPSSNMIMAMTLRRMKVAATPHGFRSTFRTWAAEKAHAAHEVAEAALAHVEGNKTVAAYQRGDLFERRRRLMDAWAIYCETGADVRADNVVTLVDRAG